MQKNYICKVTINCTDIFLEAYAKKGGLRKIMKFDGRKEQLLTVSHRILI